MAALPSEQRLEKRRSQRLRDVERRVRSNRSSQRNSVTNRAVLATMLWGVSLGTVLILIDFFLFGSLLVAAATAVIVYLAFHMQTARQQRWRSLRGDAKPAGWLGLSRFKPAYLIHCLTAAGIIPAALAMLEITRVDCDPRWVFVYLLIATLIDAVDGPLARRWDVKSNAASIDGRTIDDVLDYLTFAFIPLMLIWRMNWMPPGLGFTVMLAMAASLLGFSHREAKDEQRGVFRGFPSYWNLYAIYAGIFSVQISPWLTAAMLWVLTVLTVSPVWVLYPNLAPQKWKRPLMIGGALWTALLLAMLWNYPDTSLLLTAVSLLYPIFYSYVSIEHARNTTRTLSKLRDQHAVG